MCAKLENIYRDMGSSELRKAAIDNVDTGAMMELAFRAAKDGEHLRESRADAFSWFEMAACNGELLAAEMLVDCYEEGYGCDRNPGLADYWSDCARKFRKGRTDEELIQFCPASFMMGAVDLVDDSA